MKIEGSFRVKAPTDRVWQYIRDPDQVAPCVPGCEKVEVTGPTTYAATVKVALGPIKTSFRVTVEVTTEEPPRFIASVTRGEEGGRASTLTAHNELRLEEVDPATTEVRYSSEVSIFGRLGKYGLGMMKKKAETIGADFARTFAARVEQGADA